MSKVREGVALMNELFPMSDDELASHLSSVRELIRDDPEVAEAVKELTVLIAELEGKNFTKH